MKSSVQTVARPCPASRPIVRSICVIGERPSDTGRLMPFSLRPVERTPRARCAAVRVQDPTGSYREYDSVTMWSVDFGKRS